MASGRNNQLAQGALFLIDNTGQCPTGKKYRAFIDAAIAHHLTQHTYYYQDRGRPGAKNTKRATARKFRNSLQALWEDVRPEARGRKDGDRAEALFTLKSEAITADALRIYGYDPETFSETELPGFVDESGDELQSQEQTQTASTPAPQAQQAQQAQQAHALSLPLKRNSDSSEETKQHPAKRLRTEEAIEDTDRNNRSSHVPRSSRELPSEPLMRTKEGLQSSDGTQLHSAGRPRTSEDSVEQTDRRSHPSQMPRCRACIQSKKGCDRQRPCGRCKTAGIGLEGCVSAEVPGREESQTAIGNNDAASQINVKTNHSPPRSPQMPLSGLSVGSKRGLQSSDKSQQQPAKRPRLNDLAAITRHKKPSTELPRCKRCIQADIDDCDGQQPCSNCKAAGIDTQGCVGVEQNIKRRVGVDPNTRKASNTTESQSISQVQHETTDGGPGMPRDDADEPGASDVKDTRASLGKRKRKSKDTGAEAGHREVQATRVPDQSSPSKRQATRSSVKDTSSGGQDESAAPVPESAPSNVPDAHTTTSLHDTPGSSLSEEAQSRMFEEQARRVPDFDLGAFLKQLTDLQRDVEQAAIDIIACIGDIHNISCALALEPSEQLRTLYVRCFGADWEDKSKRMLKFGGFATPQNTMSLIAAFLYEKVINQQACEKEVAQNLMTQLQGNGPIGRAILQALDWPKRELEINDAARIIATEEARTMLVQDDAAVQSQLQIQAETLMKEFWNTILPHFHTHQTLATIYRLSSGRSEDDLFGLFNSLITPIIQKTLHHKLQLIASRCKHAYFWPCDGEPYNFNDMQLFGAQMPCTQVGQTIFPGLRFDVPFSIHYRADPVIKAWITGRHIALSITG